MSNPNFDVSVAPRFITPIPPQNSSSLAIITAKRPHQVDLKYVLIYFSQLFEALINYFTNYPVKEYTIYIFILNKKKIYYIVNSFCPYENNNPPN